MAASITSVTKIAPLTWRYAWSGTAPFYVIRNGRLVHPFGTTKTSWIFQNEDNEEPPVVEVYDSTEASMAADQLVNPPYALLQWWHATGAAYYVVQEQDNASGVATWTNRPPIVIDKGVGYYTFSTGTLDDETPTSFRVIAYDVNGETATIGFDIVMVRNPDAPSISLSYNAATGNLTASART